MKMGLFGVSADLNNPKYVKVAERLDKLQTQYDAILAGSGDTAALAKTAIKMVALRNKFENMSGDDKTNIKKLTKIAVQVDALSKKYEVMSDNELRSQTDILKKRYQDGETLDEILPDAFAAVREAGARVLNMRHFFVQIIGGIALSQGRVAEMKTGEGKTLVATLPAYLNALTGKGVHIVTVNDYLAKRDAEWMGRLYKFMGLTVGVVCPGMEKDEKVAAYQCDITYATNNELGFDYLRDNMVVRREHRVQRPLSFAIVDEVDSILIDEARTPLIISGRGAKSSDLYVQADRFVKKLIAEEDFKIDEKEKSIELLEPGSEKAESFFHINNLGDVENTDINHHIQQALKARFIMKRDNDYIVSNGEIIIVDEFTGRLMIGRRYSQGLHQAIEAKEGVKIRSESQTLATITFQNYFRLYKKLSGMTGTAKTEEEEFKGIYNLDVVRIPTNLAMIREDLPDVIYKTMPVKVDAIADKIAEVEKTGQPILVGTVTVEKSEQLSDALKKRGVKHCVLNAKNHAKEAEIVAQAGRFGAVTIATNMAGRGTDILLGGNPEFAAKDKMRQKGYSDEQLDKIMSYGENFSDEEKKILAEYDKIYAECKAITDEEKRKVLEVGGLMILGSERHESRRIDDQLRGRSGRQGDPGLSVFYISMEDDLARLFGGDRMKSMFDVLKVPEDTPLSMKMLSRGIENAQRKIEGKNYGIRKHVIQYDDVINKQREIIYGERNKVLEGEDIHEDVLGMFASIVDEVIDKSIDRGNEYTAWDLELLNKNIEEKLLPHGTNYVTEERAEKWGDAEYLSEKVLQKTVEEYEKKIDRYKEVGIDFHEVERILLLKNVDDKWVDHIDAMDQLRRGVSLRSYAQQDPLIAYKMEASDMFDGLIADIQADTGGMLLKVELEKVPTLKEKNENEMMTNDSEAPPAKQPAKSAKTVGRNDPCPCGSGKKYKNCCGQ